MDRFRGTLVRNAGNLTADQVLVDFDYRRIHIFNTETTTKRKKRFDVFVRNTFGALLISVWFQKDREFSM